MRKILALVVLMSASALAGTAWGQQAPAKCENPNALGVARAIEIDTSDENVRAHFMRTVLAEREARRKMFRGLAVDEIVVRTDADVARPLVAFFRARERRRRRG